MFSPKTGTNSFQLAICTKTERGCDKKKKDEGGDDTKKIIIIITEFANNLF